MTADTNPLSALSGVRVIDLSIAFAGADGTRFLADYGADVIKVESKSGDHSRSMGSHMEVRAEGGLFVNWNRGKRSIVVDFRNPETKEMILRLVEGADVVVQNFRPGVTDDMGIGYDAVAQRNPRAVYVSMSGFGHTGPLAGAMGTDPVVQALSGIMSVTGEPGRPPVFVGVPIADFTGSLQTALSVAFGLLARERTGRGQHIRASMFGGLLSALSSRRSEYWTTGVEPQAWGGQHALVVPMQVFETQDGLCVAATQPGRDGDWLRFCRAVGVEKLAEDERFLTNELRVANRSSLSELLQVEFLKRPTAEWKERFQEEGALFNPVWTIGEAVDSEQAKALGLIQEVDHWRIGRVKQVGPILDMSDTPGKVRPSPRFGEHTVEVLNEAGFTQEEIDALIASKVTFTSEQLDQFDLSQ